MSNSSRLGCRQFVLFAHQAHQQQWLSHVHDDADALLVQPLQPFHAPCQYLVLVAALAAVAVQETLVLKNSWLTPNRKERPRPQEGCQQHQVSLSAYLAYVHANRRHLELPLV
tara:strand:- start:50 stop:388 length:339 start_codon:yes stop_codon:yes gene_type:complete